MSKKEKDLGNIEFPMDKLDDLIATVDYALEHIRSEILNAFISHPENFYEGDRQVIWCDFEMLLELKSKLKKY